LAIALKWWAQLCSLQIVRNRKDKTVEWCKSQPEIALLSRSCLTNSSVSGCHLENLKCTSRLPPSEKGWCNTVFVAMQSPPAIQVVKARFPDVHHVGDVRKLDRTSFSGNVDLVVGGFPCQDLSAMGRREG
jgi:hypothetical protein